MAERQLYSLPHILTLVVNGIAILIGILITIFYRRCKALHTFPCYNKLTINLIIFINNLLRVIPLTYIKDGECQFLKDAQGYLIIFSDKFFLIILTNQIIIQYLGIMHTNYYFLHEKQIFIYGTLISAIISLAIAGIFIVGGASSKDDKLYYYGNNDVYYKKVIDTIYDGILVLINILCLIVIIINSSIYTKKAKISGMGNTYYEHNFTQALIKFFANIITYLISFLIIFRVFTGFGLTDFIYLLNCVIVDIIYCFNIVVIKELCKFCCNKKLIDDKEQKTSLLRVDTYGISDNSSEDDDEDDF